MAKHQSDDCCSLSLRERVRVRGKYSFQAVSAALRKNPAGRVSPSLLHLFSFLVLIRACASDWPQFLGPTRNGVYAGADLAESWANEGPPVDWKKKVGQGFSGPAVSGGSLILFHR